MYYNKNIRDDKLQGKICESKEVLRLTTFNLAQLDVPKPPSCYSSNKLG